MSDFETRVYPEDIAEKLIAVTNGSDDDKEALTDALYYLNTICENPRNHDYFRTLYKYLEEAAATTYEIKATYYDNPNKPGSNCYTKYFPAASINEAMNNYCDFIENHDCAKYTAADIANVCSYKII